MKLLPRDWGIVILVFLAVLTGHLASSNTDLSDSVWSIHTAMSIVKQCNIDLDEYSEIALETGLEYTLETVGGHTYTTYPIGASIVAVPFVFVADRLARPIWGLDLDEYKPGDPLQLPDPGQAEEIRLFRSLSGMVMAR